MVFTWGPGLLSDATLTYSDAKRRFAPFEIKLTACSVLLFEQTAKFRRAVVWFPKLPTHLPGGPLSAGLSFAD
jgi:hypothetical protein